MSELVIRQACSAFMSNFMAFSSFISGGMVSEALTSNIVNCVRRSTVSRVPSTAQESEIQENFDARAIALKVSMKQSATVYALSDDVCLFG